MKRLMCCFISVRESSFYLAISISVLFSSCSDDSTELEDLPEVKSCFEIDQLFDDVFVAEYVLFRNCSENATSYDWDFGDGNSSSDEAPEHTYATAGTYTVRLEVTGEGETSTSSEEITIVDDASGNVGELDRSGLIIALENAYVFNVNDKQHQLVIYGEDMVFNPDCPDLCLSGEDDYVNFELLWGSAPSNIVGGYTAALTTFDPNGADLTDNQLYNNIIVNIEPFDNNIGAIYNCEVSELTTFRLRISTFNNIYVIDGSFTCFVGSASVAHRVKYRGPIDFL